RDKNVVYVASEYLNCIFKVDMNFSPAHVRLYAGIYDTAGFANAAGTGATNAMFNSSRTIAMNKTLITYSGGTYPVGTMFVGDGIDAGSGVAGNNLLRYVTPDGLTVGTVCGHVNIPNDTQIQDTSLVQTYSPSNHTPIAFSSGSCYVPSPRTI